MIVFKRLGLINYKNFSWKFFFLALPLGISFILYMVFGMLAIRLVNIPMYTTLRRTTAFFVVLMEYWMMGKTTSPLKKFSVGVMVFGALIAGLRDLEFDIISYGVVLLYNCSTSMYLVLIDRTNKNTGLDKFDLMFYNGLVTVPILFIIIIIDGELQQAVQYEHIWSFGFQLSMLGSCTMAFFLNYTIFWNTLVNSPLTQNVTGQAKDVLTIIIGFFLFHSKQQIDPFNVIGVVVGFIGGCLYAYTAWKKIIVCTIVDSGRKTQFEKN